MQRFKATPSSLFVRTLAANVLIISGLAFGFGCRPPVLAQQAMRATPLARPATRNFAPLPADAPAASEINAFQEADRKRMPPTGAVLFLGSSTIRLWSTLTQDFPEIPVINRGFGGSLIQDSTRYADRIVVPYKPKMIVFFAGTNDLAYGNKKPQQVFQDFKDFVAKVHSALPDTRIVYLSINPTVARWNQQSAVMEANYLIEKFIFETKSPTRKLNFINTHAQLLSADGMPQPNLLQADGLHLNAEGYKAYTAIVKPRVLALAAIDGVKRLDTPRVVPQEKR